MLGVHAINIQKHKMLPPEEMVNLDLPVISSAPSRRWRPWETDLEQIVPKTSSRNLGLIDGVVPPVSIQPLITQNSFLENDDRGSVKEKQINKPINKLT